MHNCISKESTPMGRIVKEGLFNRIAPVYGMFFAQQKRGYGFVPRLMVEMGVLRQMSILDVGCGTGALASVLRDEGFGVTGTDPAKEMLNIAKWKTRGQSIPFVPLGEKGSLPFDDKTFDVVVASYVLHGLKKDQRMLLYSEMRRVARKKVIIHDYNKNRSLPTSIVEWLEGGDYFNFIHLAEQEMKEIFATVEVHDVGKRAAWYVMSAEGID